MSECVCVFVCVCVCVCVCCMQSCRKIFYIGCPTEEAGVAAKSRMVWRMPPRKILKSTCSEILFNVFFTLKTQ